MFLLPFEKKEVKWLPESLPTIHELVFYLKKLNDNIMVYVKNIYINLNIKVYEMSNGSSYSTTEDGKWFII